MWISAHRVALLAGIVSLGASSVALSADKEKPADPRLTVSARRVLSYLRGLEGRGMLAGQEEHNRDVRQHRDELESKTGRVPALRGFELAAYSIDPIEEALAAHRRGELVTFSYHMGAPPLDDGTHGRSKKEASIAQVLTAGTNEHQVFVAKLDNLAARLRRLAEADVPVLWRPFHEMNGKWFWWGPNPDNGNDGAAYQRLWRFTFERLTRTHGLHNLIWVWSASYEPDATFYPGDDVVDIVGTDTYHGDDAERWAREYRALKAIAPRKPVALTETDLMPSLATLRGGGSPFVWFLTWHTKWLAKNTDERVRETYLDRYVITADELPANVRAVPKVVRR
jgi:mannan endo-1,4-beta-mannosidase